MVDVNPDAVPPAAVVEVGLGYDIMVIENKLLKVNKSGYKAGFLWDKY